MRRCYDENQRAQSSKSQPVELGFECNLPTIGNPYLDLLMTAGPRGASLAALGWYVENCVNHFGFGLLNQQAMDLLKQKLPHRDVCSVGAGRGYVEWQLSEAGFNVVAYDVLYPQGQVWFPSLTLIAAEELPASWHPESVLLLGFPDRLNYAECNLEAYLKAGGRWVLYLGPILDDSSSAIGCSAGLRLALSQLTGRGSIELPNPYIGYRCAPPELQIFEAI